MIETGIALHLTRRALKDAKEELEAIHFRLGISKMSQNEFTLMEIEILQKDIRKIEKRLAELVAHAKQENAWMLPHCVENIQVFIKKGGA